MVYGYPWYFHVDFSFHDSHFVLSEPRSVFGLWSSEEYTRYPYIMDIINVVYTYNFLDYESSTNRILDGIFFTNYPRS